MALTTIVPQDGVVVILGTFEETAKLFYDVSANALLIQTPGSDLVLVDRITISNTGAVTIAAGGLTVTAGGITITAGGLKSAEATGNGIGYSTGAGGAVTQGTNRTTGVTLNTLTGAITTHTASLAAEAAAAFVVTNSTVAIGDTVIVSQRSGSNGGNTDVYVSAVAAGSFTITVANDNAAAGTAETGAIIINFAVIKAVSA